jgi:signal transduction histidine kinase
MKRLRILIFGFCLAISLPLAYVTWQTYQSLDQEERAQLQFFSETLLDEMEAELADLVQREENRAVDEYNYALAEGGISPLSSPPRQDYILGYLQNNPDGSFQTPLVADRDSAPLDQREALEQLKAINAIFNSKKFTAPPSPSAAERKKTEISGTIKEKAKDSFADRYIARPQQQDSKIYLGRKTQRTEEITANQALNLSKKDPSFLGSGSSRSAPTLDREDPLQEQQVLPDPYAPLSTDGTARPNIRGFQVEVAPLQSVFISRNRFFIFRRLAINNQIFRQGFILDATSFSDYLAKTYFEPQPMALFCGLRLQVVENGHRNEIFRAGASVSSAGRIATRTFPVPFNFLSASIEADILPASPARRTLTAVLILLGLFMLLGLVGIYHSARVVVELSERRSQFVSSVTHELKTPLTNIRMYIEMLEQGIAATPEREQDYFHILGSESARLSRLINNVLELAKLEKKQRNFDLQKGRFQEVLAEVQAIMAYKLSKEGFSLEADIPENTRFFYDREVMIQVLINLIENSIKFGRAEPLRRISIQVHRTDDGVRIAVADTGPGIPQQALKKIFDDFYRVDNDLTRTSGGTGIGLALVKKFIAAMGGTVRATNNSGPGCTITLNLPA